ncbi:MAG: hypothetical protein B6I20_09620 [Bacteroidetes bacterium 4572_117]|nr:MAG: hypothetical protein B6I20_09620 [Bacteroidetes bacterium 4572_117]
MLNKFKNFFTSKPASTQFKLSDDDIAILKQIKMKKNMNVAFSIIGFGWDQDKNEWATNRVGEFQQLGLVEILPDGVSASITDAGILAIESYKK